MHEADYKLFHNQTLFLEALFESHPEFNPSIDPEFTNEERSIFAEYFFPDYSAHGDSYRQALDHIATSNAEIPIAANKVLAKFLKIHGVEGANELLIPELRS